MKRIFLPVLLLFFFAISGCTDNAQRLPVQTWKNFIVTIETRPPTVREGMNEFLIIVNEQLENGRKKVANDLIVTLQIKGQATQHQGIQDGHVGVYRRAINVIDPATDVLIVQIEHGQEVGYLEFHLRDQKKIGQ